MVLTPGVSMWLLVATPASNFNTDPGYCRTTDPDMALSGSPALGLGVTKVPGGSTSHPNRHDPSNNMTFRHQHGSRWRPSPQKSTWVLDGNRNHRHQHRYWLQEGHGSRYGPQLQFWPRLYHVVVILATWICMALASAWPLSTNMVPGCWLDSWIHMTLNCNRNYRHRLQPGCCKTRDQNQKWAWHGSNQDLDNVMCFYVNK